MLAFLLTLGLGAGAGAAVTYSTLSRGQAEANRSAGGRPVKLGTPSTRLPDGAAVAAAAVAEKLIPSVVRIQARTGSQTGTGSGVVYRSDGYIVTNDHVITGARDIQVQFPDGEALPATLVGTAAPAVDIAVVKVDRKGLNAAPFGSAKNLVLGELAVAIGSPFGLDSSVSAGVISGLNRTISIRGSSVIDAVQTDAPLQPGNSGGPLANAGAEVIGINTLVLDERGGNGTGLGLAISSETVRRVADQIIETGRAEVAYIGIQADTMAGNGGARVTAVVPGQPAAAAGLRPGDVIVRVGTQKVTSTETLISTLVQNDVGKEVELQYLRSGTRRTAIVIPKPRPAMMTG